MKKDFLEKYLFFLRDWDNHAATIFNRSQLAYLENMQEPRAWGAESPSSLPGKQNPRSGFGVTLEKLALTLSQIRDKVFVDSTLL